MSDTTADILLDRAKSHGDYSGQSEFSQQLKDLLRQTPGWEALRPYQKESLEMNAMKTSRILFGDPHEEDHWADIAGYSRLSADLIRDANQLDLFETTNKQESTHG